MPLVLIDRGDGTYTATTTINMWSESENGIKAVELRAMDFWSNEAQTVSVQVTLDNPAPELDDDPPSDDFDGPALDLERWEAQTTGGAAVAQDGRLVLSIDDEEAFSQASVASRWRLYGDLDVQVEWELAEGMVRPHDAYLDAASVTVEIGGESYVVTRQRFVGWDRIFFLDSVDAYSGDLPTAATSGRYRLIREGATLWVLIDVGEGWQRLDQKTVSREPARITLGAASVLASTAFTTYFDGFHVNEGRTNGWRACVPMVLR
jgi:hypothetical protein